MKQPSHDLQNVFRSFGNVLVATIEPPQFKCAGLGAVVAKLPPFLMQATGAPTVVAAPFFRNAKGMRDLALDEIAAFEVPSNLGSLAATICYLAPCKDILWHSLFVRIDDERVFEGVRHPYDAPKDSLRRDPLIFGKCVATALTLLGDGADWRLMLNDWQAATIPMALAGMAHLASISSIFVGHQTYDASYSDGELEAHGYDPRACPGPAGTSAGTVLERALPLVRARVVVSQQFANDIRDEIIQREILAKHLQTLLGGCEGIDNGPFVSCAIPEGALAAARAGDPSLLLAWKAQKRGEFLEALDGFEPTEQKPIWGNRARFDRSPAAPWFVIGGRDDSRQKGFDVAAAAVEQSLELGLAARFLFLPMPGDEGLPGLDFLRRLAARFSAHVLVLPFLFREGFTAAMCAADGGIMSSSFEPFGAGHEISLSGAIPIARATGGLMQQIVPIRSIASFSHAVEVRTHAWYDTAARPTGILFRERDGIASAVGDWTLINKADYMIGDHPETDRVASRKKLAVFREMAAELCLAMKDAAEVRRHPRRYADLIVAGIEHIEANFSWEKAAHRYARLLGF